MKLNHFSLPAILMAFVFLGLQGCFQEDVTANLNAPQVQSTLTCTNGTQRRFPLSEVPPLERVLNYDFAYRLSTEPLIFTLNDCLCSVKRFSFTFSGLPASDGDIVVVDKNELDVDFDVERDVSGPGGKVIIEAPALVAGNTMDVYTNLEGVLESALVQAGGLCIIENLDGGGPTYTGGVLTEPYKTLWTNNNGGVPSWAAFIPTAMTSQP
ncbi:MAG: hypothetical protein AAF998_27135 [Bacteroidota bacterium]